MNLTFIKSNDRWLAEFKVSAEFNLHIEGVKQGNISLFQRTIENGAYAYISNAVPTPTSGIIYDSDFSATIYPKYIRVSCATEPTMAVVSSAEEVEQIDVVPEAVDFSFRLTMDETETSANGEKEGNYTGTYNTIAAFAKGNGTVEDYGYSVKDEETIAKADIKVNNYKVNEVEYHEIDEFIKMQTDALASADADGAAVLRRNSVSFAYALPKEEPESPSEPEVLTYAFEIPVEERYHSDYYETYYGGELNADFGDIYNKIDALAKAFGEDLGYQWYLDTDKTLEKTNIIVNGHRISYIESNTDGHIVLGISGVFVLGGDAQAWMTPTSIQVDLPQPWNPDAPKPESEVIEYHFEMELENHHDIALYGSVEGDFSEAYSVISAGFKKYGETHEGYILVSSDVVAEKFNITINEDKVVGVIEWDFNEGLIIMSTNAPQAIGGSNDINLTPTSLYYERGL